MSVPNGTQSASEIREVPPSLLLFAISLADPQGSAAPSPLFLFSKLPQKSLPITAEAVAAFTYPELPAPGAKATALSPEEFAICFTDGSGGRLYGFVMRYTPAGSSMMEAATLVTAFNDQTLWRCVLQTPCILAYHTPLHRQSLRACLVSGNRANLLFALDAITSWNMPLAVTEGIERPSWLSGRGHISVPWIRSFRGGLADRRVHDLILNVPVHRLISVIQGLLMERRVIVTSTSPSRLSSCVFGLLQLLFPLKWEHIFIPILPPSMTAYVCAPMPFLVGVLSPCMPEVLSMPIEDVLVLNVDDGRVTVAGEAVTLQHALLQPLPGQHWNRLADAVYAMLDAFSGSEAVIAICGAFFEFFMSVMGSYGKHMKQETHGKVMDFDAFTSTQAPDMQPFVSALRHVQMFESWFQGRGMLSAASLSDCPFENACKLTSSQPYTPSYDSSGRNSGSVGELRFRGGGASRAGPSGGDTLQARVRGVYLAALKARDRQDGGAGSAVALETVAVPAGDAARGIVEMAVDAICARRASVIATVTEKARDIAAISIIAASGRWVVEGQGGVVISSATSSSSSDVSSNGGGGGANSSSARPADDFGDLFNISSAASPPAATLAATGSGGGSSSSVPVDDSNWADFSKFDSSAPFAAVEEAGVWPAAAAQGAGSGLWTGFGSFEPAAAAAIAGPPASAGFGEGGGFGGFGGGTLDAATGGWAAAFPAAHASAPSHWPASFEMPANQVPASLPVADASFGFGGSNSFAAWGSAAPAAAQAAAADAFAARSLATAGSGGASVGGGMRKLGAASGAVASAAPSAAAQAKSSDPFAALVKLKK